MKHRWSDHAQENKKHMGSILLTWFDFNPSMDKELHPFMVWDEIAYPFPNFNGATVEVWDMDHFGALHCIYVMIWYVI